MTISADQVRAARALLKWKQDNLALASGMSLTAIRNFEEGLSSRPTTLSSIRRAIETAGIEFIEDDGVKRLSPQIKFYKGQDSCDDFFNDVSQIAKKHGGEVLAFIKNPEILTTPCGIECLTNLERLTHISQHARTRCLLLDNSASLEHVPGIESRRMPNVIIGPSAIIAYGNQYATLIPDGRNDYFVLSFVMALETLNYRKQFDALWNNAHSLLATARIKRK